ncbi:uncharacterized protein LOC120529791 [Polypterus senegalus]|uniref:uncharacterized protein LOC120529791 n=1 Tax=Polypterus senegalus TaxID=55291 RepID=UPI00196457C3|nr:uncharacterized protein LOC120529791 [Polypterus senegalus]XP_039609862.1 uncharacterized protein LOC120529791 [Polypterus senegalus]
MSSQDVQKAVLSISKAEGVRQETALLMKPYANWEEFLMPGPLSIAILGELVFISSKDDFSINKNPPIGGFKYIRNSDSFRACLMQVTNNGWVAFNEAHKNMDQIRLHSGNVPSYMKMAVKTLMQGNPDIVEALLPGQLKNIDDSATECTRLAETTEKKFMDVILLIQEMLEACMNAKKVYDEDLKTIKMKLEEAKIKEESAKLAKELSEKNLERLSKQLDEAQDQFKKSMDSMPSGWEIIGMNFVEGLTESVSNLVSGMVSIVTAPCSIARGVKIFVQNSGKNEEPLNPLVVNEIYVISIQLLKWAQQLNAFVENDQIKWKEIYDERNESLRSNWVKTQFEEIEKTLKGKEKCKPQEKAIEICQDGISICHEMARYKPPKGFTDEETSEIINKIRNLKDQAERFDTESKSFTSFSFCVTPPNIAQQTTGKKKSVAQTVSDNARFKIEQSQAHLKQVLDMQEKNMENLKKNNQELADIFVTMHSCHVNEIDFNTAVKMLVKGLEAMGRVKEQWEKMVRFFQMISNLIKASLNKPLKLFVDTANDVPKIEGYSSDSFVKDLIYTYAFQSSNIASLVHMIAGTYTEVSSLYLMDRVSSLGKLMALDPENPQFECERAKLRSDCESAQEGILNLVLKNKNDFDCLLNARVKKIENELQAVLPPISGVKRKRIESNVQAGLKELTEEEEDQFT